MPNLDLLEFLEFSECLHFLVYIHSYTVGCVDEACEFLSGSGCKLWMCSKPPKKVGPGGGTIYIYTYIYIHVYTLYLNCLWACCLYSFQSFISWDLSLYFLCVNNYQAIRVHAPVLGTTSSLHFGDPPLSFTHTGGTATPPPFFNVHPLFYKQFLGS